jgi:hypothetical protein
VPLVENIIFFLNAPCGMWAPQLKKYNSFELMVIEMPDGKVKAYALHSRLLY